MVKKRIACLLLALVLMLPGAGGWAEENDPKEAPELTKLARMTASNDEGLCQNMRDRRYTTTWRTKKGYVEFSLPEAAPVYGLYICLSQEPLNFAIQAKDAAGEWQDILLSSGPFLHRYLPLEGLCSFRIQTLSIGGPAMLSIAEIYLLGEGALPSYVQQWNMLEGKADLMILSAHPDDELLWFGGTIPTYAADRGMKVQVVCMTTGERQRKNELLDALWASGETYYPVIGPFPDTRVTQSNEAFRDWGGGSKRVFPWVTEIFRRYQPDVVLSHDRNGEYGHGAHRATATAAIRAYTYAAQPDYAPDSAYGPWQVKKLYLHLYEENQVVMNWRLPLAAFGGKTSFDVAAAALKKHKSQHPLAQEMEDRGPYDCTRFGLYASEVGMDTGTGDFFEHLPQAALAPEHAGAAEKP